MSSAICPKCSRPIPSGRALCSNCYPQSDWDALVKGKLARLWYQFLGGLILVAVICGIAAALCFFTGTDRTTTGCLAAIAFLAWTLKGLLSCPSEQKNQPHGWWAWTLPWPVILLFFLINYYRDQDKRKSELEKGHQPIRRLSEQSVIASGTERYWAEFSKILAVPTELTTSADAAWLDRIVARGRADIANIRKLGVLNVDNELLVASGVWTAASERMLAWLVRNKELLITLNQGRDLSDPAAEAESAEQVFALCASLPAEGLPPELAEFRTVILDVDVASGRLDELRIRLSERYKGRKFDWPAE